MLYSYNSQTIKPPEGPSIYQAPPDIDLVNHDTLVRVPNPRPPALVTVPPLLPTVDAAVVAPPAQNLASRLSACWTHSTTLSPRTHEIVKYYGEATALFAANALVSSVIAGGSHMLGAYLVLDNSTQSLTNDDTVYLGFHYKARDAFVDGTTGMAVFANAGACLGLATLLVRPAPDSSARMRALVIKAVVGVSFACGMAAAGTLGHLIRTGDVYEYAQGDEVPDDDADHIKKHSLAFLPLLGVIVAAVSLAVGGATTAAVCLSSYAYIVRYAEDDL